MRPLPEEILTQRLRLHKSSPEEADEIFAAIDRDRANLERWLPWVPLTKASSDTRRYLETALIDWSAGAVFDYSIRDQQGRFLGRAGLHTLDWSVPRTEFGYWLCKPAEGKGYVTEAIQALEAACWKLNFERLEIRCDPNNLRSASVPRRLGYTHEGTLRAQTRRQGQLRDTMVWAKLRR